MQERIQKILAHGGIASRRAAEQLIEAGRVRVNGKIVTELGAKANPRYDKVEVDGKRVVAEDSVYLILHKPRGVVSTMSDPEGRPSVKELVSSVEGRLYPVGRLDFATSGVLLITNDGELHDGLLHPKKAVPKTYVLKVKGVMKPEDLEVWRKGVRLEDGMTLPAQAKLLRHEGDKTWLELTIREGRNQQIRRMGEATGFPVMRLARVAFAELSAEGLAPGRWRFLTREELQNLKKEYGVPRSIPAPDIEAQPTRRIQARAVTVRGSAVKGAAGRASRNMGAEANPRFSDRAERSDRSDRTSAREENWGSDARSESRGDSRSRAPSRDSGRNEPRGGRGAAREGGESRGRPTRGAPAPAAGRGGDSDSRSPRGAGRGGDSDSRSPRGDSRGAPAPRGGAPRGERSDSRGAGRGGEGDSRAPRGDSRAPARGDSRGAGRGPAPSRGAGEGENWGSRGGGGGESRGGPSRTPARGGPAAGRKPRAR